MNDIIDQLYKLDPELCQEYEKSTCSCCFGRGVEWILQLRKKYLEEFQRILDDEGELDN